MSAVEIVDALGIKDATELSRLLGGKYVYLPRQPAQDNVIAETLSLAALEALIAAFGNGPLWIPTEIYRRKRDAQIQRLTAKGCSAKRLARALRISPRTVRHISRFDRIKTQKQRQADG